MSDASPKAPSPEALSATLGPSSFIVLGFVARCGGATSYDLKRWADESVGYFWNFPRSQLYAEPQKLAALGLLSEQQEANGRRKRTYALTPAGQQVLESWLAQPAGLPELRDLALLKLFFMTDPVQRGPLAAEQLSLHRERLALYQALQTRVENPTLEMGRRYEEACIAFWETLEQ